MVSKCIDITGSETVTDYIDGAVGTYIDVIARVTVIYYIDCVVCKCIGVASPVRMASCYDGQRSRV